MKSNDLWTTSDWTNTSGPCGCSRPAATPRTPSNNKVTVNGAYAKPSREVKIGDVIAVRRMQVTYSYKVLDLVSSRQPAKNVPLYCLNVTPQEELDKLNVPRETIFIVRDRGTGRPTKKERRELDGLMEEIYYDEEE